MQLINTLEKSCMLDNKNSDLNVEFQFAPFKLLQKYELGETLLIYLYYICQLSQRPLTKYVLLPHPGATSHTRSLWERILCQSGLGTRNVSTKTVPVADLHMSPSSPLMTEPSALSSGANSPGCQQLQATTRCFILQEELQSQLCIHPNYREEGETHI